MPNKTVNLIEPTLFDQAGHSYGYVATLLAANHDPKLQFTVWLDKRGKQLLTKFNCTSKNYFYRPIRQIQKLWLYLHLIRRAETLFIGTTELWDLKILAFYCRYVKNTATIILHFHQFKQTNQKLAALKNIAPYATKLKILTPTDRLTNIFKQNNFSATTVPCPVFSTPRSNDNNATSTCEKVIYAGAARRDKGFPTVVKFLHYCHNNDYNFAFAIQASAPNSQRYDTASAEALALLQKIKHANVTIISDTLDQQQYLDLFKNSICLLLYDATDYRDKFSGVALDAFYAGCPIITAHNTWMGDVALKYQAGIALDSYTNDKVLDAVHTIINNYSFYQQNARIAAIQLSVAHDPKHTLAYLA